MLFSKKLKAGAKRVGLEGLVDNLRSSLAMQTPDASLAKIAVSKESFTESDANKLVGAVEDLKTILQRVAKENEEVLGLNAEEGQITEAQQEAALAAGVLASDPAVALSEQSVATPASNEFSEVVSVESLQTVTDGFSKRAFGKEAYDESANRNAASYSIAYNLKAARQDEFGETLFPTVTVTPDNVGFAVSIRLVQVYDDFKRSISGNLDQYNMINIVRGFADPNVLKNELTRAIPVHRTESTQHFAVADVPASNVVVDGESISTAPLKFNNSFSLIAISQTDALLANGAMDTTDSIDPGGLRLRSIYYKIGDNVIKFDVKDLATAVFHAAPQGVHRLQTLNFTTNDLLVNKDKTRYNGVALNGALAGVVSGDYIVRVGVQVTGNVNVQTGETSLMTSGLRVTQVQNADGDVVDHTVAGAAKTLADAIIAATAVGYDLIAYRANANRRQRGQLLDIQYFNQLYTVPFRSPITALKPVNSDASNEAGDLAGLISATQIRTSNAAVTQLLETANILKQFVDSRETTRGPQVLGVARYLVKATYIEDAVDAVADLDSLTATQRAQDLQALLVNKVRDIAFRLWRDSEYQAMATVMKGGAADTPTVIIATDPYLARYLQIDGDLRTAGAKFDVRLVSTLDERMKGKIAITFGDFTNTNEANPLHFGNMAWKPELTLNLPIARGGQISKELTVQPAFLHITNLPILGMVDVSNVSDVIASKVSINSEIQ